MPFLFLKVVYCTANKYKPAKQKSYKKLSVLVMYFIGLRF